MSIARLTERDVDVARCLLAGKSNQEIAVELGIRFHAVKHHLRAMEYRLELEHSTSPWGKRIRIAMKLYEAAREFPLIAAALEI